MHNTSFRALDTFVLKAKVKVSTAKIGIPLKGKYIAVFLEA